MIRAAAVQQNCESSLPRQQRLFQNDREFQFFLGAPNPAWLWRYPDVPLFVSRRQMPKSKFQRAVTNWALDSGGFTELQQYGMWTIDAHEYGVLIDRYHRNVGRLLWAAPQDWMCEPAVIAGGKYKTGRGYVRNKRVIHGVQSIASDHRAVITEAMMSEAQGHPFLVVVGGFVRLRHDIEVHHIDRVRENNAITNLLAVTKQAHAQIHHRNRKPEPWECWPPNPVKW